MGSAPWSRPLLALMSDADQSLVRTVFARLVGDGPILVVDPAEKAYAPGACSAAATPAPRRLITDLM